MTRIAYLDCFSGISGDMLLGALHRRRRDVDALSAELAKLDVPGWSLRAEPVRRGAIAATLAHVDLAESPQPHRRLPDILSIIGASSLPQARSRARVERLPSARRRRGARPRRRPRRRSSSTRSARWTPSSTSSARVVGLRLLGIERLYCSPLPAGGGTARSAHGDLPVPAPATLELMAMSGAPLASSAGDRPMEMVTPTGAAIVTALATFERPAMTMAGVAHGAGGRDPEGWPNVLRLWLGDAVEPARPAMLQIETNIDDMNPEIYGYVQERLFAAGAADVWFQPIQMKKNRPGVLLSVLCSADREHEITAILLRETSTLGVRVRPVSRHEAQREMLEFESSLGRPP